METRRALEFVSRNHFAVLTTLRPDGTPQQSPVTVGVDGAGHVVISTRETAVKVAHLRRDPRAWLCVFTPEFFGEWVYVNGDTEIVELPEALPLLEDYYRSLSGEHPDWDDYRAAMVRDRRVLLRVTPTVTGPDRHG